MSWRKKALLAMLAVLLVLPLPGRAADPLTPWRYVQALFSLQDRMVQGDEAAWRIQARLLRHMGEVFALLPEGVWAEPRNAEALLAWLLSGGNPEVVRGMLQRSMQVALPEGALEGAVAYVEGRNGLAWSKLQGVDETKLGWIGQAQLLLVKAELRASASPRGALRMLARVRLLRPGTLLEEAALRRALFLAGHEGEVEEFERLAMAYLRRFASSRYLKDFLQRAAWLLVRLDYGPEKRPLNTLLPLLKRLKKREQALLLAAVARGAVIAGKHDLAALASDKALALKIRAQAYEARVRMWRAAAQVAMPEPGGVLDVLRRIDTALLDERDRRLRRAALLVGRAILDEPKIMPVSRKAGASEEAHGDDGRDEELPVITRAKVAVAGIETLLGEQP